MEKEEFIEKEDVDNTDYIAAIEELKKNSVAKDKYDAVVQENKKLLKSLVDGTNIQQEEETPKESIADLVKAVNDENQTNLSYITNALKLRKALMDEGREDPFVPQGMKISATDEDRVKAQRIADGLQYLVDIADGNPDIFNNEYQRIVKDTVPIGRRK